jgi:hypothetical protein
MPPEEAELPPRERLVIAPAIEREEKYKEPVPAFPEVPLPVPEEMPAGPLKFTITPEHEEPEAPPAPPSSPALLEPLPRAPKVMHGLEPPRKMTPEQIEDAWREGITLWQDACEKQQWQEALHVDQLLVRMGEPPANVEAKGMGVVRQAELLRRAHALGDIKDPATLQVELSGFYIQYGDTLRAYPDNPALYAHCKTLYTAGLAALNSAGAAQGRGS